MVKSETSPSPSMSIATVDLRAVTLAAPIEMPNYVRGTYGEMWHWPGDGRDLITLVLASRGVASESPTGVRHRLLAEVGRVCDSLQRAPGAKPPTAERVDVPGASAAYMSRVDGLRGGVPLHNLVAVAERRGSLYLMHVAALDTVIGRELASKISSSLRLTE